jgi:hypothetical protein
MLLVRLTGTLVLAVALASCNTREAARGSQALTPAESATVQQAVRSLTVAVARDVSEQGPIAWGRYFEDDPAFFMAVNGQIAFASGQAAQETLPKVALTYRHIELNWGEGLRIDPLTRELAVLAAPWREVLTDSGGHILTQTGYFTALAEYRSGRWQFRNAHWSSPLADSPAQ